MQESGTRPLVHIGFHKTASTLLQNALFARPDLGFERLENDRHHVQLDFVKQGAFDGPSPDRIESYRRRAREAQRRGNTLVVSHERLSGYPGSAGFDAPLIADRLKECLPDARILVFIREQRSMIFSYYLQYISDGGSLSFNRLATPLQWTLYRKPEFDFRTFAYIQCIEYYRRLFGPESVLVLPYEALRTDPGRVAREISQFCEQNPSLVPLDIFGEPANEGMPMLMQILRRPLNALFNRNQLAPNAPLLFPPFDRNYRKLRPLFAFTRMLEGPLRRRLMRQIELAVGERYAESNQQLQRMTGYDLRRFGYCLPAPAQPQQDLPAIALGGKARARAAIPARASRPA
ncbi:MULTISPECIES: sulfotransferase [unclassified Novosphingobium]|uniref:sulfotransferase n=1 Tax=unclassified Novosphingobium TaxID=2644732 RepID=UPI0006C881D0|nr:MULTISPECIES: sulfotransferase [unclassified Novosphingobium]MPS67127.1 hypothetical protein [Novosphingobium sp.]TCM39850.1 sulfotransferase family protein [Novosphingobium sp. ST904]